MDHHQARPTPTPRELQLPLAVPVPLRRRRTPRRPRQAATIPAVVVPRPAALPAPAPAPSAPRRLQIPPPPPVAGAADADYLMLLAHTVVSQADAEAEAAFPRAPAPVPAGEKLASSSSSSSPPLSSAAADEDNEKLYDDAPPLSPRAVDLQNPSSMSTDHGHAATDASAEGCKKAACPQGNTVAGSSKGDQSGGGMASPADGPSPMLQLGDDDEELEPGEIPQEKPAAGCDADPPAAHGSFLGKEEMVAAAGEEAKNIAGGEPAATGSDAHRRAVPPVVLSTDVVAAREGKAATTEMSAAERKRMREVFVGGLGRDATQEDVRAALSAAGEITEVRIIRDRTTGKNKGYCFVAYRDAAMASKAVAEFGNVKICGKACRVALPEGNEKANKIARRDPIVEDYNRMYEQRQQLSPAVHSSYFTSWDQHARHENNTYALPASSLSRSISKLSTHI
ncbi:multiple RNA-binding domain-containing protein 1 [Sorghum bicolor]|uniref:multiple RNA-binding domain-containing protein 1 n=1 Tax=Sorghum bicolor TaxID=4558 RepID=UPI000B423C22|nr:multiple RNA-binding domain-containing protein 1 [Sorghum bicolor]|eukprot:XP_021308997.1 multiple RNA-binding domain-containing protein 1 [Sorghum bicolor]